MALGAFLGMHIGVTVLLAPLAVALLSVFNLAVALTLSVLTVYFRDLTHITRIVLSAAFYLVPVIYPLDEIPSQFRFYFRLNPVYYFINLFRITLNQGCVPTVEQWLIPCAIAGGALIVALYTLKKTERDLIYRL
jgi:ABC-type polysaccharide/polyol phosphate export permease